MKNGSFGYSSVLRLASIILLLLLATNKTDAQTCTLKSDDGIWIEQTFDVWQAVSRNSLKLKPVPLPWIVLFDETCVWHITPGSLISTLKPADDFVKTNLNFAGRFVDVYGIAHKGNITLPDNQQIAPQLMTFASSYDDGKKAFLVSAMPAIWQKAPHLKTEANLDVLIRSVFVHEMAHTRHREFFDRLSRIEKQYAFSESFDDDIVQNHFGRKEAFRAAFEAERDLLYRAVNETNRGRKRQLARDALAAVEARRRQFFVGKDVIYAEVEDIFLTMEGAANWAAYRSARVDGMSETDALKLIRRGGKSWSQDEGLALFLLADTFLSGWQKKVLGESAASIVDLLQKSIG